MAFMTVIWTSLRPVLRNSAPEPFHGPGEAGFQVIARGVPEQGLGPRDVSQRMLDVSRAWGLKLRRGDTPGDPSEHGVEFGNGATRSRPDVAHLTSGYLRLARQEVGGHAVLHKGEIARLRAVSENGGRGSLEAVRDEARDHRCIGGRRVLSGAIYVEVAQADGRQPIGAREDPT